MGDDHAFDGLGPAAVFGNAGMGFDGADDAVGSGSDGLGLFHDEFEGAARTSGALLVEAKGARVTVDDAAVAKLEFISDGGGALPVEEGLLDDVAFGMAANGAVRFVMIEADVARFALFEADIGSASDADQCFVAGLAAARGVRVASCRGGRWGGFVR